MELLDHDIVENRPTAKGNSYFIRKKINTPIDVISVNRTPKVNKGELVRNTSKSQFKQAKINNSTISKLENYVDEKFDEAAMKYLQ